MSRSANCWRQPRACPVHVENSGKACALAQMWNTRGDSTAIGDLVFVSVSDGVGVGIVVNGEILRGAA